MENMNGLDMDFDGVFRLSNPFDEDITLLWNSKEYTFKAHTRSPMVISGATPEEHQEIRKKFAYRMAERMWFKSDEYKRLNKLADFRGGRDDASLQPLIDQCLAPLPEGRATVKDAPKKEIKTKGTKPVGPDENLNAVFADDTKDENLRKVGKMPNSVIN